MTMAVRITRAADAQPYSPPHHTGVDARRLQSVDAFWVGLSVYQPGGAAETSPTAQDTVYVVLDGSLVLSVSSEEIEETLRPGDSVHLPRGTVRSVRNLAGTAARLLVVMVSS